MTLPEHPDVLPEGGLYLFPDAAGLWLAFAGEDRRPAIAHHLAPAVVQQLYEALAWYLAMRDDEADADA